MPPKLCLRVHALQRMFERGISVADVTAVLEHGDVIQEYPADMPYPSRLILGWRDNRPLHVVVADDRVAGILVVVTAYEPDPALWEAGFRRKTK
ncbi:DUF4258 domain-containing protein [candidate division WOR-3 bacterium]|nr:DUF4258 domain-containing protein [candidate division WOR-3 bacterium]